MGLHCPCRWSPFIVFTVQNQIKCHGHECQTWSMRGVCHSLFSVKWHVSVTWQAREQCVLLITLYSFELFDLLGVDFCGKKAWTTMSESYLYIVGIKRRNTNTLVLVSCKCSSILCRFNNPHVPSAVVLPLCWPQSQNQPNGATVQSDSDMAHI